MSQPKYKELFRRCPKNPILTAAQWPYPAHTVFNPGAIRLENGTTLLLCRVEDRRGISHLTVATSENGIDGWNIDSRPSFESDPDEFPEELWGIEDPRITYLSEDGQYVIAYTSYGNAGPGVSLATTTDFRQFERRGLVMQADNKDAAVFPRKINGHYHLIHRPVGDVGAHIWIAQSPDLENWGHNKILMPARRGAWWDARKVGLSPPPIETEKGWLIIYHGVRTHASGSIYRLGLALLELENPERCLLRSKNWIMGPEADYELFGDVGSVVFSCGTTIADDGNTLRLYYGAADTSICVAESTITELLEHLEEDGTDLTGIAAQPAELLAYGFPPPG